MFAVIATIFQQIKRVNPSIVYSKCYNINVKMCNSTILSLAGLTPLHLTVGVPSLLSGQPSTAPVFILHNPPLTADRNTANQIFEKNL